MLCRPYAHVLAVCVLPHQDANQVVIRGSEDAVLAAITAVKAVIAADKAAQRDDAAEDGDAEDKTSAAAATAAAAAPAGKPKPSFPTVPLGASPATEAALLAAAQQGNLSKNARRRAKKRAEKVAEPTWEDGLRGIDSSSSLLFAQLLGDAPVPKDTGRPSNAGGAARPSNAAAPAPAPASRKLPPPPGLSAPTQDPMALLAQLLPASGAGGAQEAAPAVAPTAGGYYVSSSGFSVRL